MSQTYRPIRGPEIYSPEWFAVRSAVCGASEAAMALGMSQYGQARDLYERKVATLESQDDQNGEQLRGHHLEAPILAMYAERKRDKEGIEGALWTSPPMLMHPENRFVVASCDALFKPGSAESRINFKTAWPGCKPVDAKSWAGRSDEWGEPGSDDIPLDVLLQMQQQCYVVGSDGADVPVLTAGLRMSIYHVPRNDDIIHAIVEAERELMERIANSDPPDIDYEHRGALKLVKGLYGDVEEIERELTEDETTLVLGWQAMKDRYNAIGKAVDAMSAEVRHLIGTAAKATLDGDERFIERKIVKRAGYEVKATEYVDIRLKKPRKK